MDTNDDDLLDSKPEQTVTEQVEEEKPTVVKSSGSGLFSDGSDMMMMICLELVIKCKNENRF